MFYNNFLFLCNKIGKSPSSVAEELGFSRASVNGWKSGKIPRDSSKLKIAHYFDISVNELMNETDIKKAPSEDEAVSDELIQFALFGGKVDDETYEDVKRFAAFIKAKKEEEKKGKG